jgi:hypothetical protein
VHAAVLRVARALAARPPPTCSTICPVRLVIFCANICCCCCACCSPVHGILFRVAVALVSLLNCPQQRQQATPAA